MSRSRSSPHRQAGLKTRNCKPITRYQLCVTAPAQFVTAVEKSYDWRTDRLNRRRAGHGCAPRGLRSAPASTTGSHHIGAASTNHAHPGEPESDRQTGKLLTFKFIAAQSAPARTTRSHHMSAAGTNHARPGEPESARPSPKSRQPAGRPAPKAGQSMFRPTT